MFQDEDPKSALAKAKHITDLKNLGPATELEFKKAGIKTVKQFTKLGWRGSMKKLVSVNKKNRHSIFAYSLIGALNNVAWNAISEKDKLEARQFVAKLRLTNK
jgi:hypothetical protein